jgi:hypothetical protein
VTSTEALPGKMAMYFARSLMKSAATYHNPDSSTEQTLWYEWPSLRLDRIYHMLYYTLLYYILSVIYRVRYKYYTPTGSLFSNISLWQTLSSGVLCDTVWSTDRHRGYNRPASVWYQGRAAHIVCMIEMLGSIMAGTERFVSLNSRLNFWFS